MVAGAITGLFTDYLKKAYDILKDGVEYVWKIFNFFPTHFKYNKATDLFALSIIFFLVCLALFIVFAGADLKVEGLTRVDKTVDMRWREVGSGEVSAGVKPPAVTPEAPSLEATTTTLQIFDCRSDEDCRMNPRFENSENVICCTPDKFEGYSCRGHCIDKAYGLDGCKHPNACYYSGGWEGHVSDDPGRCDLRFGAGELGGWADATQWCRWVNGAVDQQNMRAFCCSNQATPCFGYCSYQGSYDCWDIDSCREESELSVELVEPADAS